MIRSEEELKLTHVKLNLSKNPYNVLGLSAIYVPKEQVEKWLKSDFILRYAKFRVNVKPTKLHFENIYKQCSASKSWYSLNHFKLEKSSKPRAHGPRVNCYIMRSSSWEYDYHNQQNDIQKGKRDSYISYIRERNMAFLKLWMYGDENAELKCMVSGLKIIKIITNPFLEGDSPIETSTFYLHHLKVRNGVSVTKEWNPAELIISPGLLTNINMLTDIMGTVLLEDSTHKMIHSLSQNSDIDMYKKRFLPFGLQSKWNWNIVCERYPIVDQLNYFKFVDNLKLKN